MQWLHCCGEHDESRIHHPLTRHARMGQVCMYRLARELPVEPLALKGTFSDRFRSA